MKKTFILLAFMSFVGMKLFAQGTCPVDVAATVIAAPTCGSTGAFDITVGFRGGAPAQVSLDGFATFRDDNATPGVIHYTNMSPGLYTVSIRSSSNTSSICQTFNYLFLAPYVSTGTLTVTAATGGFNADGKSALAILTNATTDSASWMSNLNPTFGAVSSLPTATISG